MFGKTIDLLRYAFPLKFHYVVVGILYGSVLEIVLLYPIDLPLIASLAAISWPYVFNDFKTNYWRGYAGWGALGSFGGAIPYDFLFERTTLISSSFLVMLSLALMAIHLYKAHLRRQEPEPGVPIADAEEELREQLQKKEEERIRKIAEENARHRR